MEAEVRNGGRCVNNLRYADKTTLLAESEEDLMKLLQTVKKARLYLNIFLKTKILSNEKIDVFRLGDDRVETVIESFIFLGSRWILRFFLRWRLY